MPVYIVKLAGANSETLNHVLDLAQSGKLKTILDPASPFTFTENGVKKAFSLTAGTHEQLPGQRGPHGKVVIQIASV